MADGFLSLLDQKRSETVFLPAVSFGYIYAEYNALVVCPSLAAVLPSFGWQQISFLAFAAGSTVLAAYMYARPEPDQPSTLADIVSITTVVTALHLFLLAASFGELLVRVCSGNTVIVGLVLLYSALLIIRITEKWYQ